MVESRFNRFHNTPVHVGDIVIGGDNPIVIQSMTTVPTHNVPGVVDQIIDLHKAGAQIVRVAVPTMRDASCLGEIKSELRKKYQNIPLVADVHHHGSEIAIKATKNVDKVRINPGLFVYKKHIGKDDYTQNEIDEELDAIQNSLKPLIDSCLERDVVMRIGVNHGSLSERLMVMYGDTPEGMVQSAIEYIDICRLYGFVDLIVSLKASRVPIMIEANRLMVERWRYDPAYPGLGFPIHLGVTEAGNGQTARIKSAAGIATLLSEGIGDTIRVSLAEDPIKEIDVCKDILQSLGLRKDKVDYIACPSCGRTQFDLPEVLEQVKDATSHLTGLSIAVMGCIVNGPGEMVDADYGFVGKGGGIVALYRGKEMVKLIPQNEALNSLVDIIKGDGRWIDP